MKKFIKNFFPGLIPAIVFTVCFVLVTYFENIKFAIILYGSVFATILALSIFILYKFKLSTTKKVISVLLIPILFAVYLLPIYFFKTDYSVTGLDEGKELLFANKKVMIFVPHQDDEILLGGGLLENYVKYKSEIYVVFSTCGDYENIGEWRMKQAVSIMNSYGIDESHVIFLGYGDQWQGEKHIYNSDSNELKTSFNNKTKTYALKNHPAYNDGADYTRENYVNDIVSVILENEPNTIFCIDCDAHADHIALSLLFEEAMGRILHENTAYKPVVYKGFAYSTAYHAVNDYTVKNLKSTVNPYKTSYMQESNVYNWGERLRFPVFSLSSFSGSVINTGSFEKLLAYTSQPSAVKYAKGVINSDKVYWVRRTDSLMYTLNVSVSSGNANLLTDFKLYDSSDVKKAKPIFDGTGVWIPEKNDKSKTVTVKFKQPADLCQIVLYDNPSLKDNITNAVITFDDGTSINTGKLEVNGSGTEIDFIKKKVKGFTLKVENSVGENAGLTEVECFDKAYNDNTKYIKLMNQNGDFVYDYVTEKATEEFEVYTHNCSELSEQEYKVTVDNSKCSAKIEGNKIIINCPDSQYCMVKITSADGSLEDVVRISSEKAWESLIAGQKFQIYRSNVFDIGKRRFYMFSIYEFLSNFFEAHF